MTTILPLMLSVLFITLLFTLYALVHSLLASHRASRWACRVGGPAVARWYRLAYNVVAIISLAPVLLVVAVLPDHPIYTVPPPWRWLMMGGQALAMAGLWRAFSQTNVRRFIGVAQVVKGAAGVSSADEEPALIVHGFYCHMRHPLYTFSLVLIWLNPFMTLNILTLSLLATLYFYLGSIHEERRLLATFGEAYAAYQRRVPRFIPRPRRCHE